MNRYVYLIIIPILFSNVSCTKDFNEPASSYEAEVFIQYDNGEQFTKKFNIKYAQCAEPMISSLHDKMDKRTGTIKVIHSYNKNIDLVWCCNFKGIKLEGESNKYIERDGVQIKVFEEEYVNDLKQGKARGFYQDGKVMFEGNFNQGLKVGEFKYYYPSERLCLVLNYRDDILEGDSFVYSDNSDLVSHGVYKNGDPFNGTFIENIDILVQFYQTKSVIPYTKISVSNYKVIGSEKVFLWGREKANP